MGRGRSSSRKYELIDTGVFDEDRYFDVFVEYAKADADGVLVRIAVANQARRLCLLHLLPTLWFLPQRVVEVERIGRGRS